jgi:hypothetical protein
MYATKSVINNYGLIMTEMTKKPGKSQTESSGKALSDIEFYPGAWGRFERAAGAVTKSPPQHRAAKKAPGPKTQSEEKTQLRLCVCDCLVDPSLNGRDVLGGWQIFPA